MSGQHDPSANGRPAAYGPGIAAYLEAWRIVRCRKWRILVVVVLALSAGAAYALLDGPWYDATAQLLVIKKRLETTPISGPDQARAQEEYLSTHILLITSPRVILQAVRKGDLGSLDQFHSRGGLTKNVAHWISHSLLGQPEAGPPSEEKMAHEIIRALVVGRDAQRPGISPSNEILNLSFRGRAAADCPRVLEAIIASYQDFLKETYRNTNAEALELISQAREMVQKDIEAKEAAYQKFLAQTPPLGRGPGNTPQHERLLQIDAKLAGFRLRRAEIEAAIETLRNAVRSGRNPTVLVGRMSAPAANPDPGAPALPLKQNPWFAEGRPRVSPEEELLSLYLQEAKVLGVREANHPEAIAIRKQIENVRRLLQPVSGGAGRDLDLGKMKIELLEQERDDLRVAEQRLTQLFETEQQGVRAAALHEIQDDAHRKGIERDRALYDSIVQRLKEISTVKDFGGYHTEVIGPPERGELAIKKCVLVFGLSLFCGLLAGCGWAYLAELSSRKVPAAAAPRPAVLLAQA